MTTNAYEQRDDSELDVQNVSSGCCRRAAHHVAVVLYVCERCVRVDERPSIAVDPTMCDPHRLSTPPCRPHLYEHQMGPLPKKDFLLGLATVCTREEAARTEYVRPPPRRVG